MVAKRFQLKRSSQRMTSRLFTRTWNATDSFRDWHFEVVNEATKDGTREIAELKKQTAHEEVLKAQQEPYKPVRGLCRSRRV